MRADIKQELAGKWSSVLQSIGFDEALFKGNHRPCIYCGGKDRARWNKKKEYYLCNQCGAHQPIEMAMDHLSMPYKETAQYLRPNKDNFKMTTTTSTNDTAKNEARLKKINSELKVFTSDCIALKYFASRGITKLPETDCHFHPGLDYWEDGQSLGKFPAIVSKFRTVTGETSTFHITYLDHNGTKLGVSSAKKILPTIRPLSGAAIRLFPATDVLCISEGIESALSVHMQTGLPVWAAGNAGNMAALEVPESVKHVYIYADEDKNFCGVQAAYTLANRLVGKGGRLTVRVIRLLDRVEYIDAGDQYDFNDYLIAQANT